MKKALGDSLLRGQKNAILILLWGKIRGKRIPKYKKSPETPMFQGFFLAAGEGFELWRAQKMGINWNIIAG